MWSRINHKESSFAILLTHHTSLHPHRQSHFFLSYLCQPIRQQTYRLLLAVYVKSFNTSLAGSLQGQITKENNSRIWKRKICYRSFWCRNIYFWRKKNQLNNNNNKKNPTPKNKNKQTNLSSVSHTLTR